MNTTSETTQYAGIDYGRGHTNIDKATGIRFGVINQNDVGESWDYQSQADYGSPHCPKCGNSADKPEAFGETFKDGIPEDYTREPHECDDYVCADCQHAFGSESAFGDEPLGFYIDEPNIKAHCSQDGDIFVTKSPFFTYAQFCSPCAPGACHLSTPLDEATPDNRAYCFGHEWFDGGAAPYPIYDVATGELYVPDNA